MLDNFEHIEEDFNSEEAAFLNDSWAKMSDMLEKEMPVVAAPTKETAYGRYLVLLLLLITIGAGLWLVGEKSSENARVSQDDVDVFFNNNEHTNVVADAVVVQKEMEQEVTKLKSSEPKVISAEESSLEVITKSQNSSLKSDSSPKTTEHKSLSSLSSVANSKGEVPPTTSENSETSKDIISTDVNAVTIAQATIEISNANSITIDEKLELNTLQDEIPEGKLFEAKSFLTPIKSSKSWTYGLMAGIQQEKIDQGFGGFSLGVLVNRKLTKKFTLETGLNFSMTQFNNTMINNSPTAVAFNQPDPNPSSGIEEELTLTYLPSDANQEEAIQFGSASWLSIPLQLTYQPRRSWRVNMGVEYSQLLQARAQKIISNSSDSNGRITNLIAENNISALTGLTWFPRENIGIDVKYLFGFTDLSKSNPEFIEQTDTRAALQWSLVYYFNPKK